jgi:hypothetical protein
MCDDKVAPTFIRWHQLVIDIWLQVEAEANTDSRPLKGFVPRKGAGLPLFGKSSTYPPPGPVRTCQIYCNMQSSMHKAGDRQEVLHLPVLGSQGGTQAVSLCAGHPDRLSVFEGCLRLQLPAFHNPVPGAIQGAG